MRFSGTGAGVRKDGIMSGMSILRFLMVFSLVIWVGGIIYFALVVAPTVFSVLPTRHLAGAVVTRSLGALHWMGITAGLIFLIASMLYARATAGAVSPLAMRHVLLYLMLALTLVSLFVVTPKMSALRAQMGVIDEVAVNDPERVEFNALHVWSTRLEGGVLLMGLVVIYLTAQQLG